MEENIIIPKKVETRGSKGNQKRFGALPKRELKEFGVDYLKVGIYNIEKIVNLGLSVNSEAYYFDSKTKFSYMPNSIFDYYLALIDVKTNVTLAFFLINKRPKKKGNIEINNYFEITGSGLIINNLEYYYSICSHFDLYFDKIKRFDIACDYIVNTNWFCRNIFMPYIGKLTHDIIAHKGEVETLYLGDRSNKNTYRLVRIYNKKLDTKKKNKGFLYDFEKDKDYTRVEIEFRRDMCENIDPIALLNTEYLFTLYARTIHKYKWNFFLKYTYEDFLKNHRDLKIQEKTARKKRLEMIEIRKKNQSTYGNEFFSDLEKEQYLKSFINKAKKLLNNGFNLNMIIKYLEINLQDNLENNEY